MQTLNEQLNNLAYPAILHVYPFILCLCVSSNYFLHEWLKPIGEKHNTVNVAVTCATGISKGYSDRD